MRTFVLGLVILILGASAALADPSQACQLEQPQCQELIAYREYVPQLVTELTQLRANSSSEVTARAYDEYLRNFYTQTTELREIRIGLYRWQRSTATWIFISVLVLTLIGVGLAGYQLFSALMLRKAIQNAKIEIGASKMVVTTSSVGVVILLLSFAFFIVFARAIFPISS